MQRWLIPLILAFALGRPAVAADYSVVIRNLAGQPVRDAVVTLKPVSSPGVTAPIHFSWPYAVAQQNIAFNPFVLVVPVGSSVNFPNKDNVRHHVYSFSPVKKFELKLYGRDESRSVTFDKPGIVAVGCNIHDQMIAYVVVVDTPFAAKTGADGTVTLRGVPPGPASLVVWQPFMKTVKNQVTKTVAIASGGGSQTISVDLRPAPPAMSMGH